MQFFVAIKQHVVGMNNQVGVAEKSGSRDAAEVRASRIAISRRIDVAAIGACAYLVFPERANFCVHNIPSLLARRTHQILLELLGSISYIEEELSMDLMYSRF